MPKAVSAYAKGHMGEDRACEYLQSKGMVLLDRRYHSLYGEIDLIMEDGSTLVFVEVKTRTKGSRGSGLASITPSKQKRLIQSASLYLAERGADQPCRFDALEITPEGIVHLIGAFEASDA